MKYLILINAGLWRRPVRTVLTILAVAVAFVLFGVMHGVVSSFDSALDRMSDTRLRVTSRASILETIPISYRTRLLQVEGVKLAVPIAIFLGYYQSPVNRVTGGGLDLAEFLEVMPEIRVPPQEREALLSSRTGAVAGVELAEKFGWKVGDRIPLKSMLWINEDTGQDWNFDLVAIANAGSEDDRAFAQEFYFHYDYLDQARKVGKGRVHQFILGIDDAGSADRIAQEVDAMFANSSDETSTLNEKQYLQNSLRQLGDIESFVYYILASVLFTLLFMTATNMTQAIRERTSELGIMRALGFQGHGLALLIVVESSVLCLLGAILGLAIAAAVFPSVFASFGIQGIDLDSGVFGLGLLIAAAMAVLASAWPAWRVSSLSVVDAIAGENRR